MKKKVGLLLLSLIMVLAFTACGGEDTSSQDETANQTADDGIEQTVYQPSDDVLFVRFVNNTGNDISL